MVFLHFEPGYQFLKNIHLYYRRKSDLIQELWINIKIRIAVYFASHYKLFPVVHFLMVIFSGLGLVFESFVLVIFKYRRLLPGGYGNIFLSFFFLASFAEDRTMPFVWQWLFWWSLETLITFPLNTCVVISVPCGGWKSTCCGLERGSAVNSRQCSWSNTSVLRHCVHMNLPTHRLTQNWKEIEIDFLIQHTVVCSCVCV